MTWELVIVGLIILGALFWAGRNFYRTLSGKDSCCSDSLCEGCDALKSIDVAKNLGRLKSGAVDGPYTPVAVQYPGSDCCHSSCRLNPELSSNATEIKDAIPRHPADTA